MESNKNFDYFRKLSITNIPLQYIEVEKQSENYITICRLITSGIWQTLVLVIQIKFQKHKDRGKYEYGSTVNVSKIFN